MVVCPKCGTLNRPGANECLTCGADLRQVPPGGAPTPEAEGGFLKRLARGVLGKGQPSPPPPAPSPPAEAAPPLATPASPPPAAAAARAAEPRIIANRYAVLKTYALRYSAYHDVYDLLCVICGSTSQWSEVRAAAAPRCPRCSSPLNRRLLHEAAGPEASIPSGTLARLSAAVPEIVPHHHVFHVEGFVYAALDPVPGWQPLSHLLAPVDADRARVWLQDLGQAFGGLHERGVTWGGHGAELLERVLLVENASRVRLGPLSTARLLPVAGRPSAGRPAAPPGGPGARSAGSSLEGKARMLVARDILFLARALFYMLTRASLPPLSGNALRDVPPGIPAGMQRALAGALRGEYGDVNAFLKTALSTGAETARPAPLVQSAGAATDPGRQRDKNEDRLRTETFATPAGVAGLYVVADGVGGQASGEVASEIVGQACARMVPASLTDPGALTAPDAARNALVRAVEAANAQIFQARQEQGSNMSTTVTAALVLGDSAVIANVGDSRTYLFRAGEFRQITADHSFAAGLVAVGAITAEQARTHPQRTVLVRALGEQPTVEVDVFAESLQPGDMLLLCSDGLWEMVPDAVMRDILAAAPSLQAAAGALIHAANAAGGHDNITVIVVALNPEPPAA